jgi:hypothetical protein
MSVKKRHPRLLAGIGAVLLVFSAVTLATVPAVAGAAHKKTTTTTVPMPAPTSTTVQATTPSTTPLPASLSSDVPMPAPTPEGKQSDATSAHKTTTTTSSTTTTTVPIGPPGGIVPCPAGDPASDTCADMPCPTGKNCGTVVAGPTTDLGSGQFVYLNFSGFAPGDNGIIVYYCADPGGADALTAGTPPTCGYQNLPSAAEAPQYIEAYPAPTSSGLTPGTAEASMQAAEVSAPSNPIEGYQYFPSVAEPGFYCDGTAANACSIVITDALITPGHPASTPSNSVEIPVSFTPSSSGCPNGSVVNTESEFGIDVLMPELARLSCANDPSTAIIPDETATDGLQAVTDLASGQEQIAFTDDPESPDQQAQLESGSFALIPVALTANVVGLYSQFRADSVFFNEDQVDLTPTMAAGLLTSSPTYDGADLTDDVVPCSGPSEVPGHTNGECIPGAPCYSQTGSDCSLFAQLNFADGYEEYTQNSGFERSDNSGATDQLFTWLCNAPKVPLDFGVHPLESMSGAQELEVGLTPAAGPPVTTCPTGVDQVPAIGGQVRFPTVNDPSQQALKAFQFVYGSGSSNPYAAFADMNWAEADYYGMNVANLQNASGNFVLPTAQSLDAAVADSTVNPDGSLTTNYTTTDPAAYPMPSVIYAAVSTAPMAQVDATAVTTLLDELLDLTGGSETGDLPQGFVPLPASLYNEAEADVAKDITAIQVATAPTSATSTTPVGPAATPGYAGSEGFGAFGDSSFAGLASPLMVSALQSLPATAPAAHPTLLPLLGPNLPGYALVATRGKGLIPIALILGLCTLVLGMILMAGGILSRRRALRPAGVATAAEVIDPPTDP